MGHGFDPNNQRRIALATGDRQPCMAKCNAA
jgi:hypothetical protein